MLTTRASEAGLRECTARCTTVVVSPRERVGCVASLHEIGSTRLRGSSSRRWCRWAR